MATYFGISRRQVKVFQCTGEHLTSRIDGGSSNQSNIVASCLMCNATRHRCKFPRDPIEHRRHIQNRMRRKKWHSRWVYESGICSSEATDFNRDSGLAASGSYKRAPWPR
ncbi:HNH endonuclease [Paraburkholderia sp. SIMBA_030]|uniref:HNH endonuclease n=1 Tax=Paraburkholderia sp. SIMBA_030 TaxID=3085773 RepID=UPI00397E41E2